MKNLKKVNLEVLKLAKLKRNGKNSLKPLINRKRCGK